jgi:hypothetical protein
MIRLGALLILALWGAQMLATGIYHARHMEIPQ